MSKEKISTEQRAYELHCEIFGRGKVSHMKWEDVHPVVKRGWVQFAAAFPPPPDKPPGTLE